MTDEVTEKPVSDQAEDAATLKAEIERLREHNAKLLGEKKTVQSRAQELEQAQADAEQKRLEEKQEFEKLWRQEQDQRTKASQELDQLRKSIADKDRSETALGIASSLTRDNARAELLKKEALAYIQHTPDGVKIQGPDGDMTTEQLSAHLAKQFPFLVDGNQATGGGAPGSKSGGGAAKGNMGGTKQERQAAIAKRFNLPTN